MLVLDATVLINFGGVEGFDVLRQATNKPLIVVNEVVAEVRRPPAVSLLKQALESGWIQRHSLSTAEELRWVADLSSRWPSLGAGEAASIAACIANSWAIATDDQRARRFARSAGAGTIIVMGTIGLLVSAVERKVIEFSTAEALYQAMVAKGFHTPIGRLSDLSDPF